MVTAEPKGGREISEFEFSTIILSIIIGLGITRVLAGLARVFRGHGLLRAERARVLWAGVVFAASIVFWLATVESYRDTDITVADFLALLLQAMALYFAAEIIALPAESSTPPVPPFDEVRRPFFVALAIGPIVDCLDTARNGGIDLFVTLGAGYVLPQLLQLVIFGVGFAVARERTQVFLASGLLLGFFLWLYATPRILG